MGSDETRTLSNKIHAFLFNEGGTLTLKKLIRLTNASEAAVQQALAALAAQLEGTGLALVRTDMEVTLAIDGATSLSVTEALGREQSSDIGDAGLEVLAILLYRGPSTRAQVDYIRGVNTSSTMRALLSRGLIERSGNPEDGREYLYRPTVDLLTHLGVRHTSELPERERFAAEIALFESSQPAISDSSGTENADTA